MEAKLNAQQVLAFLRERRASISEDTGVADRRRGYRKAAAVLVGIRYPSQLRPVDLDGTPGEAESLLKNELITAPGPKFDGVVMLAPESRQVGLRELGSHSAMKAALEANPQERTGSLQIQFESYLSKTAKPIEEQTQAELEDTLQVLLWLGSTLDDLPSLADVDRRLQFFRILSPFETLAGDEVFRGRVTEMDTLRRYVDVLAPEGLLARLSQKALRWAKPRMQPALSVYGPGGVGKSALIARFMLEHTRVPSEARLPFAYLDFDRPALDISDPLTLCDEMLRQLQLQFPDQISFGKLHDFLTRMLSGEQKESSAIPFSEDRLNKARSILADLLGGLEKQLGPRPYIVALDTFEEVQYRGEPRAYPFWEVLKNMQSRWPFLRVVVSGRAPVTSLRLADKPPQELEIGALDDEAATAFLRAKGVSDDRLAARLVQQFGGVPLSLKLAASLVKRAPPDQDDLREVGDKSTFWSSASDEVIQGQLYERILGYIHNPRVERLAHPGLVLRRITPEIILYVLNKPCRLAVDDLKEAEELFDELRKETSLVAVDDREGALVHRPDLRRVMLSMLVQKEPAQVEEIRRAAVAWYSTQEGRRARAEELYHRLQLGEQIDKKAVADPEIKSSLQASIAELPLGAQLLLASFGLNVADEILKHASQEQAELHQAARVEELLAYGSASLEELSRTIAAVMPGLDHPSELFRSAARVAMQRGNKAEALRWIEQGLGYASRASNTLQMMGLLSERAWALRGMENVDELLNTLRGLNEYGIRHRRRVVLVQHRVQLFETSRTEPNSEQPSRLLRQIARLITELDSRELWGVVPMLDRVLEPLIAARPDLPSTMLPIILNDASPFRHAAFSDNLPRAALKRLLDNSYELWSGPSNSLHKRFLLPFLELCQAWPYHVLHVQPPYGSGTSELSEALA
jgi:hypothetical protein